MFSVGSCMRERRQCVDTDEVSSHHLKNRIYSSKRSHRRTGVSATLGGGGAWGVASAITEGGWGPRAMEIKSTSGALGSSLMLWLALSSWGDVCPKALEAQSGHWSSLQSLGDAVLSSWPWLPWWVSE